MITEKDFNDIRELINKARHIKKLTKKEKIKLNKLLEKVEKTRE